MIPHSGRAVEMMISGISPRALLTEEGVTEASWQVAGSFGGREHQRKQAKRSSCWCCPHVRRKTPHITAAAILVGCVFSASSRIIAPMSAID